MNAVLSPEKNSWQTSGFNKGSVDLKSAECLVSFRHKIKEVIPKQAFPHWFNTAQGTISEINPCYQTEWDVILHTPSPEILDMILRLIETFLSSISSQAHDIKPPQLRLAINHPDSGPFAWTRCVFSLNVWVLLPVCIPMSYKCCCR